MNIGADDAWTFDDINFSSLSLGQPTYVHGRTVHYVLRDNKIIRMVIFEEKTYTVYVNTP